jgi:hypothetical protein
MTKGDILRKAGNITGTAYKRGEYAKAVADLTEIIGPVEAAAGVPVAVKLELNIKSSSDAFTQDPGAEVARILRAVANTIASGVEGNFRLSDINGNSAGWAFLEVFPEAQE